MSNYLKRAIVFVVLDDTFEITGDGLEEVVDVILSVDRIAQTTKIRWYMKS